MTSILATLPADVRELLESATDERLSDIYHAGVKDGASEAEREAGAMAMAVLQARDEAQLAERKAAERKRAWRQTQRGQEYTAAEHDWAAVAEGEFERAEAACPVLLSAAGLATGRNPHPMLWTCSADEFKRWASDDFQRWVDHGELTVTTRGAYLADTFWAKHSDNPWHEAGGDGMDETPAPAMARINGCALCGEAYSDVHEHARTCTAVKPAVRAAEAAAAAATAEPEPRTGPGAGEDIPPAGEDAEAAEDAAVDERIAQRAREREARRQQREVRLSRLAREQAGTTVLPPALGGPAEPATAVALPGDHLSPSLRREAGYQVDDGAVLWDLVRLFLAHYVAFRSEAELDLVTAWIFHAVARDRDDTGMGPLIWSASPRLLITSRKRGAGKSTLLDLILILTLSRRGKMPRVTPAKLARVLGQYHETAVIDEAKTIFGSGKAHMELQGCLLAGYTKRASYEVSGVSWSLFGPVAYAAKEDLVTETNSGPDGGTIGDLIDRSLTVLQPPPTRPMPEVGELAEHEGELLGYALVSWTDSMRAELRAAAKIIADEDYRAAVALHEAGEDAGNLRLYQITRPLRACARVAGPEAEAAVTRALAELNGGAGSAKAAADLDELVGMSRAWRDTPGIEDEDEGGRIVMAPADDDEDY